MVSFALRNKPWKEEDLKFPKHAKSAIAAIFEFSVSSQFPHNCAVAAYVKAELSRSKDDLLKYTKCNERTEAKN